MKLEEPIPGEAIHGGRGNVPFWYSGTATHVVDPGESMHDLIREHEMEIGPYTVDRAKVPRYFVVRSEARQGRLYATPQIRQWQKRGTYGDFERKSKVLSEARSRKIVPPAVIVPRGPNGIVNRVYRRGRAACASGCC